MARASRFGQMVPNIPVAGARIKFRDTVNSFMLIKMSMKENFMLTELMVLENMFKNVVKRMKVIGLTINHTDREN